MRVRGVLIAIMLLGACAKASAPMTVPQMIVQIDVLNGKTVRVGGYLGTCLGGDCYLFIDKPGQDAELRWRDATEPRASEAPPQHADRSPQASGPVPPRPPSISIGGGAPFARKATQFENSFVVVTGKATNRCRDRGRPSCGDASIDIEPTDIVSMKDL